MSSTEHTSRREVALPAMFDRHRILGIKQVAEILGLSVAHIRRLNYTGKFPKPTMIGSRKLGWPAGVILDMTDPDRKAPAKRRAA